VLSCCRTTVGHPGDHKIDQVDDKGQLFAFAERVTQDFRFAAIVPVSAKLGSKLDELLEAIRSRLPQGDLIYGKDDITDRSERFLAAEILREKIFRYTGDELPYSTSVVIEQFKMEGRLRRIHARYCGSRIAQGDADRKKGREAQGDRHQARLDMEKLFDGKCSSKCLSSAQRLGR